MTPILKPKNAGGVHYNTAHRHTRCVIEICFGLLKRCFPCQNLGLHTALVDTLLIIVATAVACMILHLCTESKTLMETLNVKMFLLTLLLQQRQVGMPNASSLFHDTLLNKINDLIKWHVRFIDSKIGNKGNIYCNQLIIYFFRLEIYDGYIS